MKTPLMIISVIMAALFSLGTAKAQDYKCFSDGMKALEGRNTEYAVKLEHISCRAGRNDVFKGCRRETKQYTLPHAIPDGWMIESGTAHVYVQDGRYTERTRATLKRVGSNTVDVEYWCQGHGCGGEGTSYSDAYLRATLVRSATPAETADLRRRCGL